MDNKLRRMERRMLSTIRGSKKWQRLLSVLSCVVVFVTTYAMILPAITMTKPTYCGKEEHTHTPECYQTQLTCTLLEELNHEHTESCFGPVSNLTCQLPEGEGHIHGDGCYDDTPVLTCTDESEGHVHGDGCYTASHDIVCGQDEAAPHTHGEGCYETTEGQLCDPHVHTEACSSSVAVCGKAAHTHVDACYVQPEEDDTQDPEKWEEKLPELTGHWAKDLLAIVRSQMGYAESALDVNEEGNGRSIYAADYGVPYINWDAAFVSWALDKMDIPDAPTEEQPEFFPRNVNTELWAADLKEAGKFFPGKTGWTPAPGDLMFFSVDGGRGFKRVAVVVDTLYDEEGVLTQVRALMGDCEDKVDDIWWNLSALTVQGWSRLPVNPDHTELYTEDELLPPQMNNPVEEDEEDEEVPDPINGYSSNTEGCWVVFEVGPKLDTPKARIMLLADTGPLVLAGGEAGSGVAQLKSLEWQDDKGEWHTRKDGDVIPANAQLRINMDFAGVDPHAVQQHGYQIIYETSEFLGGLDAKGNITMGGEVVGTFSVKEMPGGKTGILLDVQNHGWVDSMAEYNNSIKGSFSYQGYLDLDKVDKAEGDTIPLAGINLNIGDKGHSVAKYGKVDVTKSSSETIETDAEGKKYLQYTLTVEAGPYGSPDVKVIDEIAVNSKAFVNGYVGVDGTSRPAAGPADKFPLDSKGTGSVYLTNTTVADLTKETGAVETPVPAADGSRMAWLVGDMGPNETRTLTYRVYVKDDYIGIPASSNRPIKNDATITSENFKRDTDIKNFTPKAGGKVSKTQSNPRTGEDGRTYIDYTVTMTANADNNYVLNDVIMKDVANGTGAATAYASLIKLEGDISVEAIKDGTTTTLNLSDPKLTNEGKRTNPKIVSNSKFDVYVGDMAPGEKRVIKYTLSLDSEQAALVANNTVVGLYNNVTMNGDEKFGSIQMDSSNVSKELRTTTWSQKSAGDKTEAVQTITMPDSSKVYKGTDTQFTVPIGAYEYRVAINQQGQWNVSSSQWKDSLQAVDGIQYMKFVGYAQVDVYESVNIVNGKPVGAGAVKETRFIKIDGDTGFNFNGSDIGLENESDAYIVTYYAVARTPEELGLTEYGNVIVGNSFNFSGSVVGPETGKTYIIPGFNTNVKVTAQEPGVIKTDKLTWYYDDKDADFANGAIYWVIAMEGDRVAQGHSLTDNPSGPHRVVDGISNGGFYVVSSDKVIHTPDGYSRFDYRNLDALLADGTAKKVPESVYTVSEAGKKLTFNETFTLNTGETLCWIVKTEPTTLPAAFGYQTYTNQVISKNPSGVTLNDPTVSHKLTGPQGSLEKTPQTIVFDQFGHTTGNGVFRVTVEDGGSIHAEYYADDFFAGFYDLPEMDINRGANRTFQYETQYLLEKTGADFQPYQYTDGLYLVWRLSANKKGTMAGHGGYWIEDTLPQGLDLAYVRTTYAKAQMYPENTVAVQNPEWVTDGWEEHCIKATTMSGGNTFFETYYYTKGNQVRVYIPKVRGDSDNGNDRLDYQLVTKLPKSAELEMIFGDLKKDNSASLYTPDGDPLDFSSSVITVSGGHLGKTWDVWDLSLYDDFMEKIVSTRIPFYITVNSEGIDMSAGSENSDVIELPLVDRVDSNMELDLSTVRVYLEAYYWSDYDEEGNVKHTKEGLLYYGGMWSADEDSEWYNPDPAKQNTIVGNLSDDTNIIVSTRNVTDANGKTTKEVLFHNLPNNTPLVIDYKASVIPGEKTISFGNKAFWDGFEDNSAGEVPREEHDYEAQASMSGQEHGAVHIRKYDEDDTTIGLGGAEFGLYRAAYVMGDPSHVVDVNDNPLTQADIDSMHLLAVYQGEDHSAGSTDPEINVRRYTEGDLKGYIYEVEVRLNNGTKKWMKVADALSEGYSFHHKLQLDGDGNIQICPHEIADPDNLNPLAMGATDANGNLSYGFGDKDFGTAISGYDQEDAIHFNKIYAIREEKAPLGYEKEAAVHYFVVPNDDTLYNGAGANYFYHKSWPDNVHIVTQTVNGELTYMLSVSNKKYQLSVDKDFAGSHSAYKPGDYSFGVWASKDDGITPETMLTSVTISYTADDFAYDAEGNIVGLKDGVKKSALFPKELEYGTYYFFELNDGGYPILPNKDGVASGTIHGTKYTPILSGSANDSTEYGKIVYTATDYSVSVTNASYSAKVTKQFADVSGKILDQGLVGEYSFGIWKKQADDNYTAQNRIGDPVKITWEASDTEASKSALFEGLEANTEYMIYEVNADGAPILEGHRAYVSYAQTGTVGTTQVVHYENNSTGPITAQNDGNVVVTNAAAMSLPRTGGMGTNSFTYGGLALMSLACLGYFVCTMLRRRGKGDRTS